MTYMNVLVPESVRYNLILYDKCLDASDLDE
jgi:hypothetical protein